MRIVYAGLMALLIGGGAMPASAIEYPWCAEYSPRGSSNCGFTTLEQCRATVSGVGGYCRENLFYHGPASGMAAADRPRAKKRRHVER